MEGGNEAFVQLALLPVSMGNNTISLALPFDSLSLRSLDLLFNLIEDDFEREGLESVAEAGVELRHELDPVETKRVQEGGESFHHDENGQGEERPSHEHERNHDRSLDWVGAFQAELEHHVPQDFRKLCRAKREIKVGFSQSGVSDELSLHSRA